VSERCAPYCSALTPRYDRLRKVGMLTVQEMALRLGISPLSVVDLWTRKFSRGRTKPTAADSASSRVRWHCLSGVDLDQRQNSMKSELV
jgi:hypothetical protein